MALYFRYLPNIEYINRSSTEEQISNFTTVKNLFKRGKIREDIFEDLTFFTKYDIIGDERPDNVAYKIYGNEQLDWIVLLSNNILNVYDEWPMTQEAFDTYLINKYGSYEAVYSLHHYETKEIKDSSGNIIVRPNLIVPSDFSVDYYDKLSGKQTYLSSDSVLTLVRNYEYEEDLQNKKRNIFLLKQSYVSVILNDMEKIMPYKEGGEQYVNPTLKRVDDIRLYEN
jgi:hypothetical protein